MDISKTLKENPTRRDVLDVCIGLVTDKHGQMRSYDELVVLLQREFPEKLFTLSEIEEFFMLKREMEDLRIYLGHIYYDDRSLYQY